MIYNKENKQSQDECHEIALATTQNNENSLDDSLTYVKTRLPVATTSMHISKMYPQSTFTALYNVIPRRLIADGTYKLYIDVTRLL
jgi:hypothetical protein